MKKFRVTFVDGNGIKSRKVFSVENEPALYSELNDINATAIEVKPVEQGLAESLFGTKVTSQMVELIITNLASLLNSGITLDRALTLVAKSAENEAQRELVEDLQNRVRGGQSFASAMEENSEHFDALVINLVRIGESTGLLAQVLTDLSLQLKFQEHVNKQVKQAGIYPLIIVFVCILSVLFILYSVVPQLSGMLEQVKELPGYTVALMSASDFVRSSAGIVTLVAIASGIGLLVFSNSAQMRGARAKIWQGCQKLPLISSMVELSQQLRFSAAMRTTLNSGLSITDALGLSANTLTNEDARIKFTDVKQKIQSGTSLTEALDETGLFSTMELGFIEVGEETGDLTKAFSEMQERKGQEFDTRLASTLKMLEPLLILLMGVIVGAVVIIMMLSIMSAQDVGF
ncbi:type II secretion system F family protein [Pseudoalteromonas sp. YIC-656]|uniref:type II secretion system F family protein n=1 Tax=Pseudoalteromonas pernae TaxID=3118054 RepID=UPI0032425932